MGLPAPADVPAWESEVRLALETARAELAACDELPGDELWHRMEDIAVIRARAARGLPPLSGDAATIDRAVDAMTDITERLRRHGGGDPNDHHINESQFFLLYYLAAQVHANAISESLAGAVVKACWNLEPGTQHADEVAESEEEDSDDDEDEPWDIRLPPPTTTDGWLKEVVSAWRESANPPPLRSAEGAPVVVSGEDLRESAVVLALHQRGCTPPAETIYGLTGVISEMEEDIASLGPELAELKKSRPLSFVLYYVWTHILIGHASEDIATALVQIASEHIADFAPISQTSRAGSSRFRRRN